MALGWEWLTDAQRAAVRTDYQNAGVKLIVSAFGATGAYSLDQSLSSRRDLTSTLIDTPTTSGYDPIFAANWLADWTIKYGLVRSFFASARQGLTPLTLQDGVDIDYEDFAAMNSGKAEAWLIPYTRQLRARLPPPYIRTLSLPCASL